MFCSKCGTQNPDDAKFCSKCGNNISLVKSEVERKGITGKLGKMGIPGFRTGKTWKMVLAALVYFFLAIFLLAFISAIVSPPQSPPPATTSVPTATISPSKAMIIKHSFKTMNTIGKPEDPSFMWRKAPAGKTFLILTLDIKNNGYERFNTNPFNWQLEVNKIKYPYSDATYLLSESEQLESVDVLDGGLIKGSLAFEVPEGTTSYIIYYNAPFKNYSIKWEYVE